jgi:DNA-binding NtrC family response regulator
MQVPRTLLYIDDRHQQLTIRKAALELRGYKVLTASSCASGINSLKQHLASVVLLEYKLEGMDAEAVAVQIKRQFPDVPIILLSAYADLPERVLWCADECVMKSATPAELDLAIARVTSPRVRYAS